MPRRRGGRRPSTGRTCIGAAAMLVLGAGTGVGSAVAAPTIERDVIARSPEGAAITVFTIAEPGDDAMGRSPDERPAIAIIAGVQGHHQIGARVAEAIGQRLIDEHADVFDGRTLYVIPRLNPEGLQRFASNRRPRALAGKAPEPMDADRDRRVDEDPPNDLNGDGLITLMRVPAPQRRFGIMPTHIIDADDPRIVREPNDDDAMAPTHAIMIEGVDDDGDGAFNEDGWGGNAGGGVDLDKHFPTHWPEHTDGAGRFPLDRAEARGVVDWLQSRGNIGAVIVYGPHDTIVDIPRAGQYGPDGRVPRGIEEGDTKAYELAREAFKETTGVTKTEPGPSRAGSLVQWCYADLGVYVFATPVWVRPDLVESTDDNADEGGDGDANGASANEDAQAASESAEAAEPTAEEIEAADRQALAQRDVPQEIIDFIYMTAEERMSMMESMQSASEDERVRMMQQLQALPDDVRARVMALAQGQPDPGPGELDIAGGGDSASGPAAGAGGGDSADAKWLAWIDEHNEGEGFVEWTSFDHPQLGEVEIGGFVPGVRVNPPRDMEERLIEQQAHFAARVLEMMPRLIIDEPIVERVGDGVWRIGVTLMNEGRLPTQSAVGVKSRRIPGVVVVLDPEQAMPTERVLTGSRVVRFDTIAGDGNSEHAQWLVAADDGAEMVLEVRSPRFGTQRFDLTMTTNEEAGR